MPSGTYKHKRVKRKRCVCEWCKKEFETWESRPGRFCSGQCRTEFAARQPRPKRRNPNKWVDKVCNTCGKGFPADTAQIRLRGGGKYCSRKCQGIGTSKRLLKDGGPNYRGGITKTNYIYYRGSNWDSQKRKAMKRDNHECQVCHYQGGFFNSLAVHHIKPYRLFGGDFESANQLSNLITLCRKHHGLIESGKMPCPKPKS